MVDAAEDVLRRVRAAARRHRPRGGARGRLAARPRGARHQQDPRVVARRRRHRGRLGRGRRRHRAPRRQPPHRRRADRAARRARRAPRRPADAARRSTQVPHFVRLFLALLLGESEEKVRVIAPEVGGGFGAKLQIYGEEILLLAPPRKLGRPGQVDRDALGAHDGHPPRPRPDRLRARWAPSPTARSPASTSKIIADMGAYLMLLTPTIPSLGAFVMSGCYKFAAVQTDITGVFTNKCPTDAIRGAGRPEATHMIEVMLDQLAGRAGHGPRSSCGARTSSRRGLPGGDGARHRLRLRRLPRLARQAARALRPRRASSARGRGAARARACYRGLGFSTYTEICGLAPSRVTGPSGFGLQTGLWESAMVRVHFTGRGHGLHRHLAARPGPGDDVRADRRRPARASTRRTSRSCTATRHRPARPRHLRLAHDRGRRRGARARDQQGRRQGQEDRRPHARGGARRTSRCRDGKFSVKGSPDKGMTLAEVAGAAYIPENLPEGMEPGLEETAFYDPANFVFPFGAHACVVEVDAGDGQGRRRPLRRGRRLRPGDQPDAHRRPGARRHRPRDRPGALRAGPLRRERASS